MKKIPLQNTGYAVLLMLAGLSAAAAETANAAAEPNMQLQSIKNQLFLKQMEALNKPQQKINDPQNKLESIVENINLLQIPAVGANKDNAPEPAAPQQNAGETQQVNTPAEKTGPNAGATEKTDVLTALDGLTNVNRPAAVADMLYLKGDYDRAAKFYEMALSRLEPKQQELMVQWTLFQLGNCRRNSDPAAAAEYFDRLVGQYPNSQWAQAAMAQKNCCLWLKQKETELANAVEYNEPNSI